MSRVRLDRYAREQLHEIYRYSVDQWGEDRADTYMRGMSDTFDAIAIGRARGRPVPASFGVTGFVTSHERHLIYWRRLGTDQVAIVTILHERMHQPDRVRRGFDESP